MALRLALRSICIASLLVCSAGRAGGAGGTPQTGRAGQPPPPLVTTGLIVGRVIDSATGRGVSGAIVSLNGGPSRAPQPATPGSGAPPPPPAVPPPPAARQVLSDSDGRFAFRNLTRGNYNLSAARSGYASGGYGRLRPEGGMLRLLQLGDGEKIADANIHLFKYGSLSGFVLDEAGEPVVTTAIRLYRRSWVSGRRVLTPHGNNVQTDDRGYFRVGNLLPGEYVVVAPFVPISVPASASGGGNRPNLQASTTGLVSGATPVPGAGGQVIGPDRRFLLQRQFGSAGDAAATQDADGRIVSFATTYYPSSRTIENAEAISLGPGEDRSGIDFSIRRFKTSVVSGQLIGPDGPAGDFVVRLIPVDSGTAQHEPEAAVGMTDASGVFMFLAVPPGQYEVRALRGGRTVPPVPVARLPADADQAMVMRLNVAAGAAQPLLWASAPVSVSDADVHGIGLTLREGLTISGRLEFSGSRPRPEPQRLAQVPVVAEPVDGRQATESGQPTRVMNDGRFTTQGLQPGRYFLRVIGSLPGWSIQSISAGGGDGLDSPIELTGANISNVVITFTDLVTDVRGAVSTPQPTSQQPAVLVFPGDTGAWRSFGINPLRTRMTHASPTGAFGFGTMPPGEYFCVAIPDEYSSEWQNPEYLELLSRAATRFSLTPGERKSLSLQVQNIRPPSVGRTPQPLARSAILTPVAEPTTIVEPISGPFVADEPQQVRDTVTAPKGSGSISGVIRVQDGELRPARFARVSVRSSSVPGDRIALTGEDGRYRLDGLPPGTYQLIATKSSYLQMSYGAKRPGSTVGIPVRVDPGQAVSGIDVTLARGGVVSGVIVGHDGEPAPGVRVQLLRRMFVDGVPTLRGAGFQGAPTTDDRGMFRLFGISPGSYAISAMPVNVGMQADIRELSDAEMRASFAEAGESKSTPEPNRVIPPAPPGAPPPVPASGRAVGFSPMYHPGTPFEDQATLFPIAAGQEVNISLSIPLVPTAVIDGTVVGADGQPVPIAGTELNLVRNQGLAVTTSSIRMSENGRFAARGLTPGRYLLTARRSGSAQPGTSTTGGSWAGQLEFEVNGADLTGLTVTLMPPITLSGKVVFEGGAPPPRTQVLLQSSGRPTATSYSRVLTEGMTEFTFTGVAAGRYRLSALITSAAPEGVSGVSPGWAVKSAIVDGRDAFESPIEIQPGRAVTSAVVTMTTRLSQLSTSITDQAGRNVPNMIVVLFTTNRDQWTGTSSRRVRVMPKPNDDGVYTLTQILPGEYYLVVLHDIDSNELNDPSFLDQLVPSGIKLTFEEGEKKVQHLRLAGG